MLSPAQGYLPVSLAAALWGAAGVLVKYLFTAKSLPPFMLVQVRMGLSFLLLLAFLGIAARRLLSVPRKEHGFLALFGIIGMAGVQFTYLTTLSQTNVATAIFLQYLAPILTALYAFLVERQRPGALLLACLGLAMLGSIFLLFGGGAHLLVSPFGLVSGLISAFFMSFYTICGAKGVDRFSPWTLLCYGLGYGFLFWLAVDAGLLLAGYPLPGTAALTQPSMWLFFGYIAALSTVIPFGLYLTGLRQLSPTQATITGTLEPVIAGIASYFVLGEQLQLMQVVGGALIIMAVILLQAGRQNRRLQSS